MRDAGIAAAELPRRRARRGRPRVRPNFGRVRTSNRRPPTIFAAAPIFAQIIDADELETPSSPLMRGYAGLLREPAGYADVDDTGAVETRRVGARRRSTGEAQGFSVHAEVTVAAHDAAGRERLCRCAAGPPLADAQLSMTRDGRVAVQLRGRRRGGAGHVVLEPVRLLRRSAWLIPPPGSPQVRFAGVLAGNASWRSRVVPVTAAGAPVADEAPAPSCTETPAPPTRPRNAASIAWHVLLRRTYDVDAQVCGRCGDRMRVIAVIYDPAVAARMPAAIAVCRARFWPEAAVSS